MRFAHVIFDCDGVLVDTEKVATRVQGQLFRELGMDISDERIAELFTGKAADYQARWLAANTPVKLDLDYEALHAVRMLAVFRNEGVELVPGIAQALASIGVPKSVATNGVRERATFALTSTGLIGFFERLNAVEDVANPKPAPDLYRLAAAKAGVDPAHCAVVEDSSTGVTAARAAGMTVIGFTGTAHDPAAAAADLNEAGAHILLEDMRALHTALDWL